MLRYFYWWSFLHDTYYRFNQCVYRFWDKSVQNWKYAKIVYFIWRLFLIRRPAKNALGIMHWNLYKNPSSMNGWVLPNTQVGRVSLLTQEVLPPGSTSTLRTLPIYWVACIDRLHNPLKRYNYTHFRIITILFLLPYNSTRSISGHPYQTYMQLFTIAGQS